MKYKIPKCYIIMIITAYLGLVYVIPMASTLVPPKFQWKSLDFKWEGETKAEAVASGSYIPENNMPTGLARWKDKLFITIPRWKEGVPSSLNYILLDGSSNQPLNPYPSWQDAYVKEGATEIKSNSTVVSTFRVHVDGCDRLWVVDNGVTDMAGEVKQITVPAVLIFDLKTDQLILRHELGHDVLRDSSVLTSIVVDNIDQCKDAYAYIPDMGSNAIIVFQLSTKETWRIENHYFHFDPHAGTYIVGGIDFYWSDGISSIALSNPKDDGNRNLYFHPTSSTKQFVMSTRLLRDKNVPKEDIFNGVSIVGDRGPNSQATAYPRSNVLFFTQLCKNGVGCWNVDKPFNAENAPVIVRDCTVMEFPNDVKVDDEGNLWILSNRQSRFLYKSMDFNQTNFRIMTAPVSQMIEGTACGEMGILEKSLSYIRSSTTTK